MVSLSLFMKQRYHWLRWMYYEGTLAFKGATNGSIWLKLKRASWMVGIMDLVFFFFFFLSFMTHQSPMTLEPPRNPSWKWAVVRVVNDPATHLIRVIERFTSSNQIWHLNRTAYFAKWFQLSTSYLRAAC